jgi:effector-binding domain-containing protein
MYTVDQLGDAAVIVRLRALDLPLEKVRLVLAARDPELTRRVLGAHQVAMQERLAETERIVAELQSGVAPRTHTPVHVRSEPAAHTVRITTTVDEEALWPWLEAAFERLDAVIAAAGGSRTGPHGALFPPEIAEEGVEHVEAFVPVAGPLGLVGRDPDIGLGELPGMRVAVLVHAGGYDTIGDTYRTLGAWVARHAGHAGERVRESYLVGSGDVDDPTAYRTEISWPILPEAGAR